MIHLPTDAEIALMTAGQRAMLAAEIYKESLGRVRIARKEKREWIRISRRTFAPGRPMPCAVCGRYESIAQAHHVFPLSLQYDVGIRMPIHDIAWLCPTHHAGLHRILAGLIATVEPDLAGFPDAEKEAMQPLAVSFVTHWVRVR